MKLFASLALLALCSVAQAQNPRVLLDTTSGPILLELDQARAPITVANFLAYVDAKSYDDTLIQRVVRNFVVQGGGFRSSGLPIQRRPNITSERNNGLRHVPGTIAMGLANGSNGQPDHNSANADFFFNTGTNTQLDPDFTVFGQIVFGLGTLNRLNNLAIYTNSDRPISTPLLKRAVRTSGFPIMPLHTGSWFDPAKPGRGFGVEVSSVAGPETGPLLVVYWYDYFEGEQVWMNGAVPFEWGASEVVVPLQITRGAQFGEAFDPDDVESEADWGQLTVRFTACDKASFSYNSSFGNGTLTLDRITLPTGSTCLGG